MGAPMADGASGSVAEAFAKIDAAQPARVPFQPEAHITLSLKPMFGAVDEQAVALARERAAEMVGKRLVDGVLIDNPDARWTITEPTREWLRRDIERAFQEGLTPPQLARLIREDYAFSKSRARMIAHTEICNLNIWSHAAASLAAGATHKRSKLSGDHDIDDFCDAAAEAGEVPIGHDYGFGLKWPLYHPRCECSVTFYWRKEKAGDKL